MGSTKLVGRLALVDGILLMLVVTILAVKTVATSVVIKRVTVTLPERKTEGMM